MGMVFPVSTHNYELRYWLASGGIHPGYYSPADITGPIIAEVLISVTPPPQMPATLEAGTITDIASANPGTSQPCSRASASRDHRLRNLEEQSGKGVRHHRRVRRENPKHGARC